MTQFSRTKLKNRIYEAISGLTSHIYRDEAWEGVSDLLSRIRTTISAFRPDLSLVVNVENGGYRENNGSKWKEYTLAIENEQGENVLGGTLNAHAAGTVADPFKAYDMSVVLWLN